MFADESARPQGLHYRPDFISAQDLQVAAFKTGKCGGGADFDQPVNSSWHGTRVAGMIAANTNNGEGVKTHLAAAVAKDGSLSEKAKKDLEFRAFKDNLGI